MRIDPCPYCGNMIDIASDHAPDCGRNDINIISIDALHNPSRSPEAGLFKEAGILVPHPEEPIEPTGAPLAELQVTVYENVAVVDIVSNDGGLPYKKLAKDMKKISHHFETAHREAKGRK